MNSSGARLFPGRVAAAICAFRIHVERSVETETSMLLFGDRDRQPVVLKVIRTPGEEWHSGDVLTAFGGSGMVRVLDRLEGAVLLERLNPADSLAVLPLDGRDDEATKILCDVIGRMCPRAPAHAAPTVQEWGRAFDRCTARDGPIPRNLFKAAQQVYSELCASQSRPRLLHGDLHHYNVLHDSGRGWVAIDPKGVVGEPEYELGAALRNPYERPALFVERATIEGRVDRFQRDLHLDAGRILAWAFTQAVLAVVWALEDGEAVRADHPWLALAANLHPMLPLRLLPRASI